MKATTLAVIALGLATRSAILSQSQSTPLTGAWRITQRQETVPTAKTIDNPQPGLFLFTAKHYSIVQVESDKPRPALPQDLSKATAEELRAAWGSFGANSGTYEVQGGTVTIHSIVAKRTEVMARGSAGATFSFKIEGNTLTLTPVKPPTLAALTLTRVE